jgi:hypothetical protein
VEEQKLDMISKEQGINVQTLVGLVKENQTLMDELKVYAPAFAVVQCFNASGFTSSECTYFVHRLPSRTS